MADGQSTVMRDVVCSTCGDTWSVSESAAAEWHAAPQCPLCSGEATSDEDALIEAVAARERRVREAQARFAVVHAAAFSDEERDVAYTQLRRDIDEYARAQTREADAVRWVEGVRRLLQDTPAHGAMTTRMRVEEYVLRRLYLGESASRTRPGRAESPGPQGSSSGAAPGASASADQ